MNPKIAAQSLRSLASGISESRSNDPGFVIQKLRSVLSSVDSRKYYSFPPSDGIEDWIQNNREDAIAYAVGWSPDGLGYGSDANSYWPDNPGFDWVDGSDQDSTEVEEEPGYEYRTSIMDGSVSSAPKELRDGFELVEAGEITVEISDPDYEGDGQIPTYTGDSAVQAVYRRPESNES